jgi:hypothetical protein
MNRQIGWSTESNLLWQIGNQIDRMTGVIGSTLSTFVPQSRTLTINGVTYDLSANRSWTVVAGLSGTIATGQVAFGSALNTIAGSNTFFWDNTNSYLYLGTNVSSFAFGHKIRAVGQGDASIGIFRNQANASPSKLEFFKSRGTYLVPLANSANDQLMSISAFGWGSASTQYVNAVAISAVATSIGTNGVQGQLNLTTWNNTGSNFSSLSLKNSFSAPGSGGVVTIGADASGITPLGTLHVRGFDATTSNNVVYLENSTQTQLAKLSNDGQFLIGTGAFTGQRLQVQGTTLLNGTTTINSTLNVSNFFSIFGGLNGSVISGGQTLEYSSGGSSQYRLYHNFTNTNAFNPTTGSIGHVFMGATFAPTSGTGSYFQLAITPTINQTGGSNGSSIGLLVTPTLTSAADWRSIQWTNNTGFGLYGAGTAPNYLGGDLTVVGVFRETVTTNRQTASYSLVLLDRGKLVEMNVASANNLTVPLDSAIAFPIGTKIDIAQYGAGQTTVVATSGVTIRSAGGALKLAAQYSGATLVKIATNEWYLFGDITV